MPKSRKKSSGDKKHGRLMKSPSHQRYNAERRWEKNKAKRAKKQNKIEAKHRLKKAKDSV